VPGSYQASLEENNHICFQNLQPHFLLNLYVAVFYKSLRNWLWLCASQYSSWFSFPENSSMTKQTVRGGLGDGKAISPHANSSSNLSNCLFGVRTYCLDVCFCPCLHPILMPYFDRLHAALLCECNFDLLDLFVLITVWLRPSEQIRAPLFSINQKGQRPLIVSDVMVLLLPPSPSSQPLPTPSTAPA